MNLTGISSGRLPVLLLASFLTRAKFDPHATTVRFTEQMKGFVKLDASDPKGAYEDARILDEK